MAGLTDTTIAASYDQLLIVDRDGGGNGTTHVTVKDGDGTTTFPITLATDAIMITSTNRLEFGDNASYIHQSADGVLDLVSDTEIELTATTIDINGAVDMSSTLTVGTDLTVTGQDIQTGANNYLHLGDDSRIVSIGEGNEVTFLFDEDSDQTIYLNYSSYNGGASRFRSTAIGNGKNAVVMTVDGNNSRVGIGTTSPGYQLDLRRNDTGTTTSLGIRQIGSGDASMAFQTSTSPYGFCIGVDGSDSDAFKFATGTDDVGTNTKLTITSGGNVGVGETSPLGNLHVKSGDSGVSSPDITELVVEGSGNTGISILTPNNQQGEIAFGDPQDANVGRIAYNHDSNFLATVVNGSEVTRIESDGVMISYGGIEFEGTALGSSQTGIGASGNGGDLRIYTNGTQSTTFKADGKVGIGTASPSETLQVNHSASDGDGGILIVNESTSIADDTFLGGIGFDSADGNVPSTVGEASVAIVARSAEAQGPGDKGGDLLFLTTAIDDNDDTGSHERMRITSEGNVQIPDNAKFIVGTGPDMSYFHTGTDAYLQNVTGHLYLHNNVASKFIHILQEGASGGITLSTNNTERMRITSAGRMQLNKTTDNGNQFQMVGNFTQEASDNVNCGTFIKTQTASLSSNSTSNIFNFTDDVGNVINTAGGAGSLYITAISQYGGAHQAQFHYSILHSGNGTSDCDLVLLNGNNRGTSPVSSIQLANDDSGGGVKITATTISNHGATFRTTYVGFVNGQ